MSGCTGRSTSYAFSLPSFRIQMFKIWQLNFLFFFILQLIHGPYSQIAWILSTRLLDPSGSDVAQNSPPPVIRQWVNVILVQAQGFQQLEVLTSIPISLRKVKQHKYPWPCPILPEKYHGNREPVSSGIAVPQPWARYQPSQVLII